METEFDSTFTSGQLEIFEVAPSGKLSPAGDAKLSLFVPLTISSEQTTSAFVWFQPKSRDFMFEGSKYLCRGKLIVTSGKEKQTVALQTFGFKIEPEEADALNQKMQKNILLPVEVQRQ
jgi:hypothetical protein